MCLVADNSSAHCPCLPPFIHLPSNRQVSTSDKASRPFRTTSPTSSLEPPAESSTSPTEEPWISQRSLLSLVSFLSLVLMR
jgi:hypothetical protein